METPAIEVKRRWNLPFYYRKSWICYFNILKNGNMEWAFTRGNELSNEDNWLEARGRKQIFSVNFATVDDIDMQLAKVTLQEALLLDEHVPYSAGKKPSH
ncbi:hypothetical protein O3Q51_12700 [Cryomorphaceae bacterium 1068]|nr:hypothetical protein [Cryomorphaceae bacterium 1068]